MENTNTTLAKRIAAGEFIVAPGVYDALTAKIVEAQGFPAVYMTGYGTAAAKGLPDLGLLTMAEMVENASRISDAVRIPVIADADTGYGDPLNVMRTVKAYEKAGVAAIHIEDQHWPKRCGHMSGKRVIPTQEMVSKIKAAVDARSSDEFLIIARTDAIATDGFDAAIERAAAYAKAGADVLFVEAPTSARQIAEIPRRLPRVPHLLSMAPRTPALPVEEAQSLGYSILIYPGICLSAAFEACASALGDLRDTGDAASAEWADGFSGINALLGLDDFARLEEKYKT